MLLGTLAASILWNILAGILKIPRQGIITSDERVTQASQEPIATSQDKTQVRNVRILMSPHLWTNFKIRKYCQKNLNLMVFVQEIIYLKWRMGNM